MVDATWLDPAAERSDRLGFLGVDVRASTRPRADLAEAEITANSPSPPHVDPPASSSYLTLTGEGGGTAISWPRTDRVVGGFNGGM